MTRLALAAALIAAACTPDIGRGTYYCGPERLCPPDLACDENRFTCEVPSDVSPFECPEGSEAGEPDDTAAEAGDLGALACGSPDPLYDAAGCIAGPGDVDLYRFDYDPACPGADPHIEVAVRFPIALVPLSVELLDAGEAVVESATLCTPPGDRTGTDRVCLEARLEAGTYFLRIRAADGAPDCDGECHHASYRANMTLPLS